MDGVSFVGAAGRVDADGPQLGSCRNCRFPIERVELRLTGHVVGGLWTPWFHAGFGAFCRVSGWMLAEPVE